MSKKRSHSKKVIDLKFPNKPKQNKTEFDVDEFKKQAKDVKKTFNNEDLLQRLRLNFGN